MIEHDLYKFMSHNVFKVGHLNEKTCILSALELYY